MKKAAVAFLMLLPLAALATPHKSLKPAPPEKGVTKKCTFNGFKLYGKIQIVEAFPDVKIQEVDAFPDLKVQKVEAFPDECGKWQIVDAFPDTKIQIVDAFADVKVEYVDAFPGLP